MCLIDVGSGSDTRLMVRQVLDWSKKAAAEQSGGRVDKQFEDLNFRKLKELYRELYEALQGSDIIGIVEQIKIKTLCGQIRSELKTISELSGVPIEPPKQTKLLNELMEKVPSVIYASVPGAGGDDAIFALAPKIKQCK